jgi:hypothetical protein
VTAEAFAAKYGLRLEKEGSPLGDYGGFSGKNGGINVYSSGKFQVIVVTLGTWERWRVRFHLLIKGFKVRRQEAWERRMPDASLSVEASFDAENYSQARLAIALAQIAQDRG